MSYFTSCGPQRCRADWRNNGRTNQTSCTHTQSGRTLGCWFISIGWDISGWRKKNNRWASAVREKDNEAIKTKRWWLVEDIYGDGRLTTKRAGWIEMSTTLEKEMEIPGVVVVVGIKDWSGFPSSQAAFLQTSQTTPMSGDWMGINTEKVVCALDANI